MIIIKANSFLSFSKDEKGSIGMMGVIMGIAISLLFGILIIATIWTPVETAVTDTNNTDASGALTTVSNMTWVAIGLVAIIPLALVGKYLMTIFG